MNHYFLFVTSSALGVLLTINMLYCVSMTVTMYHHERPFLKRIILNHFMAGKILGMAALANFVLQSHFHLIAPKYQMPWFIFSVLPTLTGFFMLYAFVYLSYRKIRLTQKQSKYKEISHDD